MEKLLLRPSEVQQALGFGRSKVYELLASGEIPVVRIGGSLRVPAEGLREWVRAQASGANSRGAKADARRAGGGMSSRAATALDARTAALRAWFRRLEESGGHATPATNGHRDSTAADGGPAAATARPGDTTGRGAG